MTTKNTLGKAAAVVLLAAFVSACSSNAAKEEAAAQAAAERAAAEQAAAAEAAAAEQRAIDQTVKRIRRRLIPQSRGVKPWIRLLTVALGMEKERC